MEIRKNWQSVNNCLYLRDISTSVDRISPAVWSIEKDARTGELFLSKVSNEFSFDFKVYGLERPFINHVKKAYAHTRGNMGVLLNGVKGTGKTVTGEILANELGLPILLIHTPWNGLNSFLSSIPQDITVFIDEFEKTFRDDSRDNWENENADSGDTSLLALMDGTYKTKHRKFFILTTNRRWVNDNMLNRPGRIRYVKDFSDLDKTQIDEIIDDLLLDKTLRDSIIDFLKPLKIITVDIVKSVVEEVNIFGAPADHCCVDFNVEEKDEAYNMICMPAEGKEYVIEEDMNINEVTNFMRMARMRSRSAGVYSRDRTAYYKCSKEPTGNVFFVWDSYQGEIGADNPEHAVRFEKVTSYHSIFVL